MEEKGNWWQKHEQIQVKQTDLTILLFQENPRKFPLNSLNKANISLGVQDAM